MKARYKVIVDEFASAIQLGHLPAGTRLPTHRALASERAISLATATRIYSELEAMGLVRGETGRGTFVREILRPLGSSDDQQRVAPDVLDLNFNTPSLPEQADRLRSALRQLATRGDIESLLRYQPYAGRLNDREAVASYLSNMGVVTQAKNVLMVNGAQQGLAITVMGLLRPGDVVAVDALTYPGFKVLASLYHLELVPIPVNPSGPDLVALETVCQSRRVRAIYTMPTLHNPLGWVLSSEQRETIGSIARKYNLLIIEDAAYAYLEPRPPAPLAYYAPERTIYVTGFSKNVATGLRVGAVVSPAEHRDALERAIRATSWNTPALMTSIVCDWLREGYVAQLEEEKRRDAGQRQTLARTILQDFTCYGHPNAYFNWIVLPEEARAERVVKRLLQSRISVSTAEPFSTSATVPQAIRLALGSVSLHDLQSALIKIKEAIDYEKGL